MVLSKMSFSNFLESLNSTCCLTLQQRINNFIRSQIMCSTSFILFINNESNEGLIQVVGDSILEQEFRFSVDGEFDLASTVSTMRENDALDMNIQDKLKYIFDPFPRNFLKVPIDHPDRNGQTSFLAYLVNPIYDEEMNEYSSRLYIKDCLGLCSAVLINAFTVREERRVRQYYQKLSNTAKTCLLRIGDYNDILSEIVTEARLLLNAERCSLFLLNEDRSELLAKIFDGIEPKQLKDIRIPLNTGVVGYVAAYGEVLNIHDAPNHPLFYKEIDVVTGYQTRNILCFPVRNEERQIVGVAEMCNKRTGLHFTFLDEEMATTLSLYIGIALMHSILYKRIQIVKAQDRLSNELVTYHLTKYQEDYKNLLVCNERHGYEEMLDFRWRSREINHSDTICYIVKMFENLGFLETWRIAKKTLICFVLTVRRGYRNLPYHNWSHGFSVAHFSYYLMHTLRLLQKSVITDLEGVAFIVSALCHDVDHRGTTNSFQVRSGSSLASLYSNDGSVMERHHFSQTLSILNTDNCNIFESLSVQQYIRVICLIRDMIVATDISQHFKVFPEQLEMSRQGYNPAKKAHRTLLLSLMMTACDLNDQVKGWTYCRDVAEIIYTEFFNQGDMERQMGLVPAEMMDREKAFVPKLQMEFLQGMVIPCFTVLSNIFPPLRLFVSILEDTARCWEKVIKWFKENDIPENLSINYIFDAGLEKHITEG